ncbi:MAG: DUF3788 family protein [Bryobacteraceae bacterium]
MTATPPNAFIGRTGIPADADLDQALGAAKPVWDALIAGLAAQHGVSGREWKCYSAKAGWALRLLRGKRTILWLSPCQGCFRAAFVLGDKALLAAQHSVLSAQAMRALQQAERYPEGTGVRLLVKGPKDIPAVMKLAVAKLEN